MLGWDRKLQVAGCEVSAILGSTTNEVRGLESGELVNESELRTARHVNNLESVG